MKMKVSFSEYYDAHKDEMKVYFFLVNTMIPIKMK